MGKILGGVVIVIWAFSILVFLKVNKDIRKIHRLGGKPHHISNHYRFHIVHFCIRCIYLAERWHYRRIGEWIPCILRWANDLELPFLLIVIPQVKAPLIPSTGFWFRSLQLFLQLFHYFFCQAGLQ